MLKVLDFYADWCGPCHAMKPILEEVEKEMAGQLEIVRVDVEADNTKAGQFGVASIPTFVVLKDEQEVDRKVGAMPKEMFTEWVKKHL